MGMTHGNKIQTIAELASTSGRKSDTLWRKAKRTWPEREWSIRSVLTEEEAAELIGAGKVVVLPEQPEPGKEVRRQSPVAKKENLPQPFVMPSWRAVRRFIVDVLLFCAVVAHALLIWYDCATLWDVPGQIGGGALFLIVLAALLLASDSDLPRTSGIAMAFIFFVDLAAWKVHFEVFKTPLVDNLITGSLCAFICATSYMALYIFRDKRIS